MKYILHMYSRFSILHICLIPFSISPDPFILLSLKFTYFIPYQLHRDILAKSIAWILLPPTLQHCLHKNIIYRAGQLPQLRYHRNYRLGLMKSLYPGVSTQVHHFYAGPFCFGQCTESRS